MKIKSAVFGLGVLVSGGALWAQVKPAAVFSDHAVLLKSADTPVFGRAAAGEAVSVALGSASAKGVAGKDGKWLVRLDLRTVGEGPHELRVNDGVVRDVLVGEVWLCSGQSNMEFMMCSADDAETEAKVTNRMIRCFSVRRQITATPAEDVIGTWTVNEPPYTPQMTAVGYHFAKYVQESIRGPVGIVNSSFGAATIEAWCDPETVASDPAGKRALDEQVSFMADYRAYEERCDAARRAWERKWDRADRPHGGVPAEGWRALTAKEVETFGHAAGAVWLKRSLAAKPGAPLRLVRDRFIEKQWRFDPSSVEVYWNGRRVERTFAKDPFLKNTEVYEFGPAAGEGTLAVRVYNAENIPDVLYGFADATRKLPRTGWLMAEEFALPGLSGAAHRDRPPLQRHCLPQHWPTGLYNGMVAGLVPMGLSGVIWYQGESNATRHEAYGPLFSAMITSWRTLFRKPDLPFAWCQLAGYMKKPVDPNAGDEDWQRLREAQTRTLALPRTGQAVLLDSGEENDIHPRDKRTPGRRLAAWALNTVYGRTDIPYLGPRATGVRIEGTEAVVTFAACGKGLEARDLGKTYPRRTHVGDYGPVVRNSPVAQVEGFAVKGADGVWHWADTATIVGHEIHVSAKDVPAPVAVRYGWSKNPWVNLYNAEGLPAEPFELSAGGR